jgi:LuxR family transcriptional regulator, maltose regulon positive regulatory protein
MKVFAQPASFTLISSPPGFGKTTLLSEFASQCKGSVAWVSLDESDNDPVQFWSYVIAACQTILDGVGESVQAILQLPQEIPPETIPTILINDISGSKKDIVLVLDDYHVIQNENIHKGMLFLLEHASNNLYLFMSTRIDPPWKLGQFRARNRLVEIRARDLRFNTAEASSFLNRMLGLDLSKEEIIALEERTEGWAAGLQLAALSIKGREDVDGFVKAFTGSHVYISEYLVEEVLRRQPAEIHEFLLKTSILNRLTAGLCEAVTGCDDGQAMLQAISHANLFVIPLDDESRWYRYHHLFTDLLRVRLQREMSKTDIAALQQRAAFWYEKTGMITEAIEYSLKAGDYQRVVRLVEEVAFFMILQGQVRSVESWLQAIPQNYIEKSPRINMAFAWMNLLRGTPEQAAQYIEHLRNIFSSNNEVNLEPSLKGEWLALQAKLLILQGKPSESRDVANEALIMLPETDVLVRSMVNINLATAYEQMLEYDRAAEIFQMIAQNAIITGDYTFEIIGTSGHARMELVQGKLHKTFEIASQGINRVETSGKKTPFCATYYGELSQVYYQWHQFDQSRSYSLESMQVSGKSGFSDPEIYHYLLLSKIYLLEGDLPAASIEMKKAIELAGRIPPAMIRENVIHQQVTIYLASDSLEEAKDVLKQEGFIFGKSLSFPDLHPNSYSAQTYGMIYMSALRVYLFDALKNKDLAKLKHGVTLAEIVLVGELHCHHNLAALEVLLIRSQMYDALGDESNYLADILKALELGEPEGFISIFIEQGKPIEKGLNILCTRNLPGKVSPEYIQNILVAFPKPQTNKAYFGMQSPSNRSANKGNNISVEELIEPLTNRELEVLRLIALGDSNQMIAEKLVITISAIKKHTGNIFGKLNVSNRTQAVVRARQLNLLEIKS